MVRCLVLSTALLFGFFAAAFTPIGILHLPPIQMSSAGFERPIVSITFDDGWSSQLENAVPALQKHRYFATFFLNTGAINQPGRFTNEQVISLKNDGHEIGAHSVSHPHLIALPINEVVKELVDSKAILEKLIQAPVPNFAAPFGDVNAEVLKEIRKVFASNRSVESGFNKKNAFDIYMIRVQNIKANVTPEQVEAWLDEAAKEHAWLVLVYHQVDHHGAPWSATPEDFASHLNLIEQRKLAVLTVEQALQELVPQVNKPPHP